MSTNGNGTAVAKRDNLAAYLEEKARYMNAALPKHMTPERLARVALTAISSSPRLLECTKESLALALIEAGQLGLEPNGVMGQAYLVPYYNGKLKRYEAQFQVGYRGLIDLARRSGQITKIEARVVREGDEFLYEYGLQPKLVHRPDPTSQGEMTHVYAIAWLKDAEPIFEVMTREEVERIRRRSKAADSGPWVTDYEAMARKTAVKRLAKYLPLSPEAEAAIEADNRRDAGQIVRITGTGIEVEDTDEPAPSRTDSVREKLQRGAARNPEPETEAIPDAEYAAANLRLPDDDELLPFEADDRAGDLTALAAATERPARAPSAQSEGR